MIINFKGTPAEKHLAGQFDILDADTGEIINHLCIFYADDLTGRCRAHRKNANGQKYVVVGAGGKTQIASYEFYRRVRFVAKPTARAGPAPGVWRLDGT